MSAVSSTTASPSSPAAPGSPYVMTERPWPGMRRPALILIASDGTEHSDGALRVALARAHATGAVVELLTVVRWDPSGSPEEIGLWREAISERRRAQRAAVEAQLQRVTGAPRTRSVMVLDGHPAYTISRVAIERRAALVVVGLGRHAFSDRLFSDETALQLARISRVPVLAVPQSAIGAGAHAVVAVDFGELADRAAQAAVEAVGDSGTVELVHVGPYMDDSPFSVEEQGPYERWATAELESVRARLVITPGVSVTCTLRRGRPARELLTYAHQRGADFIATGTHGRGFVARTVLGSVATQLIRGAQCAVLSVPRDPLPALDPSQNGGLLRGALPTTEWTALLESFSRRNAGRRTILEVDDLELGAQAQEYNYPLLGTRYDERAACVELMLGDTGAAGRHLTRRIGGVSGLDVLSDGKGGDVALRIVHGTSQTLLTFAA